MDIYNANVNKTPNTGCTRLAKLCTLRLPEYPIAITPNSGNPTPVTIKPKMAHHTLVPAC